VSYLTFASASWTAQFSACQTLRWWRPYGLSAASVAVSGVTYRSASDEYDVFVQPADQYIGALAESAMTWFTNRSTTPVTQQPVDTSFPTPTPKVYFRACDFTLPGGSTSTFSASTWPTAAASVATKPFPIANSATFTRSAYYPSVAFAGGSSLSGGGYIALEPSSDAASGLKLTAGATVVLMARIPLGAGQARTDLLYLYDSSNNSPAFTLRLYRDPTTGNRTMFGTNVSYADNALFADSSVGKWYLFVATLKYNEPATYYVNSATATVTSTSKLTSSAWANSALLVKTMYFMVNAPLASSSPSPTSDRETYKAGVHSFAYYDSVLGAADIKAIYDSYEARGFFALPY
jgi:hypothetical protein